MTGPSKDAFRWQLLQLGTCLAAAGILARTAPPGPAVAATVELVATPTKQLGNAALLSFLDVVAWSFWSWVAFQTTRKLAAENTRSGRSRRRGDPSSRRLPRATMSTAAHRAPLRRLKVHLIATAPDEQCTPEEGGSRAMSEPIPEAQDGVGRRREASLLGTAALLAARRRWEGLAGPTAGPGPHGLDPLADPLLGLHQRRDDAAGGLRPTMPPVHLEDPEWSRALLGLLFSQLAGDRGAVALELGPTRATAHFATPPAARTSSPFDPDSPASWSLSRRAGMLADLPAASTVVAASRAAALVTGWNRPDSRMLIDMIACGSVALDGPPVAVGATLSDVVVELATRRWCDLDELVVVGFGTELEPLERVVCLPDVAAACERLGQQRFAPTAPRGRCLVVAPPLGAAASTAPSLEQLVELVHATPATGLICCDSSISSLRCLWSLRAHHDTVAIRFLRRGQASLELTPPTVAPERSAKSGETRTTLPGAARSSSSQAPVQPVPVTPADAYREPVLYGAVSEYGQATEPPAAPPAPDAITVRVLGPVEITGAARTLDKSPRITELVVYLAFHPHGCSGEAIAAALWPDRRVPGQTVANRLSEARQALGLTREGLARLRRVSGRHVLAPDVGTDWDLFEQWTARNTGPSDWASALELVRGQPFDGLPEGGWTLLEGLAPQMSGSIAETACRLAGFLLETGQPRAAEQVVRRGLLGSPWDEELYRVLMRACHLAGNRAGLEAALRSLAHVLGWEGDPLEAVHPETARLYHELTAWRPNT